MGSQELDTTEWLSLSPFYLLLWARIPEKKWSSPNSQQKSLKCSTWVQSQKWHSDLCFQGKPFNITVIQTYAPTSNAEEAEVKWFYEDLQDLLELTPPKRCPFHYRGLECKSRKSRDTWSNREVWLGVRNETGQRLTEFCQENPLVITSTLFQQHKRQLYTWTSPDGQHQK